MQRSRSLAAIFLLTACGTSTGETLYQPHPEPQDQKPGTGAGTSKPGAGAGEAPGGGESSGGGMSLGAPTQLVSGSAALVGVTRDSRAVYTDSGELRVVEIQEGASPVSITDAAGNVLLRGRVVFNWANVDWTTNLGDLTVWTASAGAHWIGTSLYAEGLISASESGAMIAYTADIEETTIDLVVAPSDLSAPEVLVDSMGRGSDTTCGPRVGFVGERLFVGWCPVGSRSGTIERFDRIGDEWRRTVVATDALPDWSSDASAERVFYQSSSYSGYYAAGGRSHLIDAGVSGGIILPDGSAVFYNVSDQLRRTPLPEISPIPIVTRGYAQRVDFAPAFDFVLYSTKVTYDEGTKRDLLLTRTDTFNPSPTVLVAEPVASMPRSAVTKDGKHVLYMTDVSPKGSTLNTWSLETGERRTLPGVYEVAAAADGKIVLTGDRSDPNVWPVVADLKVMDLDADEAPMPIEEKIMDGRSYFLDADGHHVVYVRSGVGRDPEAPDHEGVFFQVIP